jgi:hypothetical protein
MLLLALLPMPYGYYGLVRLVGCVTAAWIATDFYRQKREGMAVLFGLLAILFNPIFKVAFERSTWGMIDIASAVLIGASLKFLTAPSEQP